jgi:error-prone DNA polymerase
MTIEDETDVANLVVWPSLFEKQRRLILSSGMIGCRGRLQREGGVTHIIAEHLTDLSHLMRSVGDRDRPIQAEHGRGDEAKIGTRDILRPQAKELENLHEGLDNKRSAETEIRISVRNFH